VARAVALGGERQVPPGRLAHVHADGRLSCATAATRGADRGEMVYVRGSAGSAAPCCAFTPPPQGAFDVSEPASPSP
jgi:hypothetical protein